MVQKIIKIQPKLPAPEEPPDKAPAITPEGTPESPYITPALWHYREGPLPVPMLPGGKQPAMAWKADGPWMQRLSEEALRAHWLAHPDHELAVVLCALVVVFDVDTPEADKALRALLAKWGIECKRITKTRRGFHYWFRLASGVIIRTSNFDSIRYPDRIDIKAAGSLITVPPSSGKSFERDEIKQLSDLTEIGQPFVDAIFAHNGQQPPQALIHTQPVQPPRYGPGLLQELAALLLALDPDCGYDEWTKALMAVHHATQGSEEGLELVLYWSRKGQKFQGEGELRSKWAGFRADRTPAVTIDTLRSLVRAQGLDPVALVAQSKGAIGPEGEDTWTVEGGGGGDFNIHRPQALDPASFPDTRETKQGIKLKGTLGNTRYLLQACMINVTYNVISKKMLVSIPGLTGSPDNADETALTHIQSLAALNGLSQAKIPDYVAAIGNENQINPIASWISSRSWDGQDRLEAICNTLHPAEDYPVALLRLLVHKWLLSLVAAIFKPVGFKARGVLTLQGPQAIGKTSWVLALVPDQTLRDLYVLTGHHLDPSNKDTVLAAISHWVVELGELESTFRRDMARLKGFLTEGKDKLRLPYGRRASEYQRRTVFCATVNEKNFLVDNTGNSRWWTVALQSIDYRHSVDMQQLYAQLLTEYETGAEWWLTPEEEHLLEQQNRRHLVVTAIREQLMELLDFDLPREEWQRLSARQVLEKLGIDHPTNGQFKEVAICLKDLEDRIGPRRQIKGYPYYDLPLPRDSLLDRVLGIRADRHEADPQDDDGTQSPPKSPDI